ncbi:hypothetical protein [Paludisphaera soli]|uniref:hypothetical protein n=1 Tax=Paludisphaera soli TaxID=2712865 RepID=UPI0013EE0A6A|nr:hypothetical protein [Paludisphaera soli]
MRKTRGDRGSRWSVTDAMAAVAATALLCAAFVHDARNAPSFTAVPACMFLVACLYYRDALRLQRARGVTPTTALKLAVGLRAVGAGLVLIFGALVAFFFGFSAFAWERTLEYTPLGIVIVSTVATLLAALPATVFLRRRLWPAALPEESSRPDDPEPGEEDGGDRE